MQVTRWKIAKERSGGGERHGCWRGHLLAAEAGLQVLRDGGNAIDAVITTAVPAMGVLEPDMNGIGRRGLYGVS